MSFSPEPRPIDLNADLGEGPDDAGIYALVTSANIACGGHAGDPDSMHRAARLAMTHRVAVGAHPSYPDREHFGRLSMPIPPAELARSVAAQVLSLARIAESLGGRLVHVKPHGALYGDAARDPVVARAVAEGVRSVSKDLVLVGLCGSEALALWRELGFSTAAEGFADRGYRSDGSLLPRAEAGALITEPAAAAAQAVRLARVPGTATICVHSDTPGAREILRAVRAGLSAAGFRLAPLAAPADST